MHRISKLLIMGATLFLVKPALAQQESPVSYPPSFDEAVPLYIKAIGPMEHPISSGSADAQAYFNQGVQMMFAFTKVDAARSFKEAQSHDPECAICHWGEAWAWGSYLNSPMQAAEAPRAYAAAQKALELSAKGASELERALIEAMAVRYVQDTNSVARARLDTLYANAMKHVVERFPDNLDAATLYGEALFLLEPRRGTRDINDPDVVRLHQVLESVLERDIRHPGACHLYIHATESTSQPEKAAACAEYLGDAIPGASHINHMPSHTWNVIGRWGDAVRANLQAWHSDQKAEINEGFAIYPSHNLHMLLFAASMDGQGAIAIQAGKDYTKLTGGRNLYHLMTLIRFGRFDEVLEIDDRPEHDVHGGVWDFSQGYAHLRKDDRDFAELYKNRVLATADTTQANFRGHSGQHLLGTLGNILQGEIYRSEGRLNEAIGAFGAAVEFYDQLEYDEPEPLVFSPRHWLGNALLDAENFAEAERVFNRELEHHPHNGWTLHGLVTALEGQNKDASNVRTDLDRSWARSDIWLKAPIF